MKRDAEFFVPADPTKVGNFVTLETKDLPPDREDLRGLPPGYRKALAYEELFFSVPLQIDPEEPFAGRPIQDAFPPFLFR
jgi:hypothetical protein